MKCRAIAAIPEIVELQIGHFLVGEADFSRLGTAIKRMRAIMDEARRDAMIIGLGSDLIDIRRSSRRSSASAALINRVFTDSNRRNPTAVRHGQPPTPSVLPPRRPAQRRWEPGLRNGVFWRDMGL
jgi:hypothetical protein